MKRRYYDFINESTEINLSPLIDMMFLLLIFFIVTTAFVEEVGVSIKRPKASTSKSLEKKSIMLGITKNGKIIYGENEISIMNVRGLVSKLLKQETKPVILIASENSITGRMIEVFDECKKGGAKEIFIATSKKDNIQ